MPDADTRFEAPWRRAAVAASVPIAAFALESAFASSGRGGTLSLIVALLAGVSIAVLLSAAAFGPLDGRGAVLERAYILAAACAGAGYGGLRAAALLFAESNLLGGWALLFGPMLWLGMLGVAVLLMPVAVLRLMVVR